MKKLYPLLILITFTVLFSCSNNKSIKQNISEKKNTLITNKKYNNFTSRIHTSSYEVDWFKLLGSTTFEKHIEDFESINWKKEYWEQWNFDKHNYPDIEVIDEKNYMYLSVSVSPSSENSFQFIIGAGIYSKKSKKINSLKRVIRIYATGTDNPQKVKEILHLFFDRKNDELADTIKKLEFLYETEDLYQNL